MARRPPTRISARYLERVTGHYLERYGTTTANLRRLLMRRVRRAARHHDDDVEDGAALVEAELARLERIGLLDDAAYALGRARVLLRRGNGRRAIRSKLAARGVTPEQIDEALAALEEDQADLDLAAACTWARKRRLGPWSRVRSEDPALRKKHLARFARAGFGYAIARRILDAPTPEDVQT